MKEFLLALVPSTGVLFLFVIGIRAILHADRRERDAVAKHEREFERESERRTGGPESDSET